MSLPFNLVFPPTVTIPTPPSLQGLKLSSLIPPTLFCSGQSKFLKYVLETFCPQPAEFRKAESPQEARAPPHPLGDRVEGGGEAHSLASLWPVPSWELERGLPYLGWRFMLCLDASPRVRKDFIPTLRYSAWMRPGPLSVNVKERLGCALHACSASHRPPLTRVSAFRTTTVHTSLFGLPDLSSYVRMRAHGQEGACAC